MKVKREQTTQTLLHFSPRSVQMQIQMWMWMRPHSNFLSNICFFSLSKCFHVRTFRDTDPNTVHKAAQNQFTHRWALLQTRRFFIFWSEPATIWLLRQTTEIVKWILGDFDPRDQKSAVWVFIFKHRRCRSA